MSDSIIYCKKCTTNVMCHLDRECYLECKSATHLCDNNGKPQYPKNVESFIIKWQPEEEARRKAFWKEFRKAANAYSEFRSKLNINV